MAAVCAFAQVDLDCLSDAYRKEQHDYYLNTSAWGNVHPSQLMGPGVCFKKFDLLTVTLDELKVGRQGPALAGWQAASCCVIGNRCSVCACVQGYALSLQPAGHHYWDLSPSMPATVDIDCD